jgi:hypothetical protein
LTSYPTGESRQELKLKLPIGNAGRPYLEPTTKYLTPPEVIADVDSKLGDWPTDLGKNISMVNSKQDMMNFLKKPLDMRELTWKYWKTAASFAKRTPNGTFCVTRKGYVGIVPSGAQVGDEVCVFDGGAVPFVLRKNYGREGDIIYELVGEGYIHGIMYGEVLGFKHGEELKFHII